MRGQCLLHCGYRLSEGLQIVRKVLGIRVGLDCNLHGRVNKNRQGRNVSNSSKIGTILKLLNKLTAKDQQHKSV